VRRTEAKELITRSLNETQDSIRVLEGGGLHPEAVAHLREAQTFAKKAARSLLFRDRLTKQAIEELDKARVQLVESS
jgi:copper homeostasis protein CutC